MNSTTRRRLALPALALAAGLTLAACGSDGDGTDTASTGSSTTGEHGGGHPGSDKAGESAKGNAADVSFLTGMKPHHAQAVEMSDIVLAATPPAEVAEIANQIKAAQAPEIEQMDEMLTALGEDTEAEHGAGHSGGHGGMMSEQEMQALRDATRIAAAKLYLEQMIRHHEGAITAADAEIADGLYEPAIDLARQIKTDQAEEITKMRQLLATL